MTTTEARAREVTYLVDEEGFTPANAARVISGQQPIHTGRHRAPEFRTLAYRSHVIRPHAGDGIAFTEACIEEQLHRILDEADVDTALELLAAFNPALSIERVESLLDLADEVARAENAGPAVVWHNAIDDYCAELRRIALDVRRCNIRAVSR